MLQTTYAHEAHPHAVVTELLLNNSGGAAPLTLTLTPAPAQPQVSRVAVPEQAGTKFGRAADCMKWRSAPLPAAPSTHTLSIGTLAARQKKGGDISLAVAAHSAPAQLHAPAHGLGGSATGGALVLVSSVRSTCRLLTVDIHRLLLSAILPVDSAEISIVYWPLSTGHCLQYFL